MAAPSKELSLTIISYTSKPVRILRMIQTAPHEEERVLCGNRPICELVFSPSFLFRKRPQKNEVVIMIARTTVDIALEEGNVIFECLFRHNMYSNSHVYIFAERGGLTMLKGNPTYEQYTYR